MTKKAPSTQNCRKLLGKKKTIVSKDDQMVPGGKREMSQRSGSWRERKRLDRREHTWERANPASARTRTSGNATGQG